MSNETPKKGAAAYFGLPTAKAAGTTMPPYKVPEIVIGQDPEGKNVGLGDWSYVGALLLKDCSDKMIINGFIDLDTEFQNTKNPDIVPYREMLILQTAKDVPEDIKYDVARAHADPERAKMFTDPEVLKKVHPFCNRKLWTGMIKMKNDGTGTLPWVGQTKTGSWSIFIFLIPYQNEKFYPEALKTNLEELKKKKAPAEDLQMEVLQYFDNLTQTAIKNNESPYPSFDCTIYINGELKDRIIEMVKVFNAPSYAYITQEDVVISFVGNNVSYGTYVDKKTGETKTGANLNVDDIWFFRPDMFK